MGLGGRLLSVSSWEWGLSVDILSWIFQKPSANRSLISFIAFRKTIALEHNKNAETYSTILTKKMPGIVLK